MNTKNTPDSAATLSEQIHLSKQHLETIFDSIPDPICVIDSSYTILRANQAYAHHVHRGVTTVPGTRCYETFWGRTAPCPRCPAAQTFTQGNAVASVPFVNSVDNETRHYEVSTYPAYNTVHSTLNVIEYIRDVTEQKHVTEQLIRSEKLASIGMLSAGVAHEMNNALSGISGNAHNLLLRPEKYGLNEKGVDRLVMIDDNATRATAIMKDLLHLSRKHDGTPEFTDIGALVGRTVNTFYWPETPVIARTLTIAPELPRVLCDPSKIEQVVFNLVSNAFWAISEKYRILKEAGGGNYSGQLDTAVGRVGEELQIMISDNGVGIPPLVASKIFDPFFTTRPPGQGTGLGLSICNRIIEEHRGRIYFENREQGAAFIIRMPFVKDVFR